MSTVLNISSSTLTRTSARTIRQSTGIAPACKLFWRGTEGTLSINDGTTLSQLKSIQKNDTRRETLKCIKLNLHDSRLATDNLTKVIEEENTDLLYLQEPYEIRNKIAGIPRRLKMFTAGVGKNRAATVVNNEHLDTILIKQQSDEDTVVLEIIHRSLRMIIASLYFDIT